MDSADHNDVVMTGGRRFAIRFDDWYRMLSRLLLLPPSTAYVDVAAPEVEVRMGWAFSSRFPRSAVASAQPWTRMTLSRGVHGFAGRWLVNGSGQGILALDLAPTQHARVLGFPVRLRQLLVSVDDPAELAAAIRGSTT
jgi:hypothetical protein